MDIMMIFDLLIVVFGVYMVIAAFKMKKSGVINTVLITPEESAKCSDREGFIGDMYWREAFFGALMALLGAVGFVNDRIVSLGGWNIVEMIVFLAVFLWFQWSLNRARKQFF